MTAENPPIPTVERIHIYLRTDDNRLIEAHISPAGWKHLTGAEFPPAVIWNVYAAAEAADRKEP